MIVTPNMKIWFPYEGDVNNRCTASGISYAAEGAGYTAGSSGNGLLFDGNVYAKTNAITLSSVKEITIAGRFKSSSATSQCVLEYGASYVTVMNTFNIWLQANGTLIAGQRHSSGYNNVVSAGVYNDGNWHRFCASFSRISATNPQNELVIDGKLDSVQDSGNQIVSTTVFATGQVLYQGRRAGTSYGFIGSQDELQMWTNKKLSLPDKIRVTMGLHPLNG